MLSMKGGYFEILKYKACANSFFYHLVSILVFTWRCVVYILTTGGPLDHDGRRVVHLRRKAQLINEARTLKNVTQTTTNTIFRLG